jgi:hypothetical protein
VANTAEAKGLMQDGIMALKGVSLVNPELEAYLQEFKISLQIFTGCVNREQKGDFIAGPDCGVLYYHFTSMNRAIHTKFSAVKVMSMLFGRDVTIDVVLPDLEVHEIRPILEFKCVVVPKTKGVVKVGVHNYFNDVCNMAAAIDEFETSALEICSNRNRLRALTSTLKKKLLLKHRPCSFGKVKCVKN